VRLLAWNLRAGGGARIDWILDTLGSRWKTAETPPRSAAGVPIAARRSFRSVAPVCGTMPEPWRMLAVATRRLRLNELSDHSPMRVEMGRRKMASPPGGATALPRHVNHPSHAEPVRHHPETR